MQQNFLNDLNPEQLKATKHTDGPVMVIAGAGSGKTRVLTYKIAYLLTLGIDPFNILSLTFTNKAAKEMKERVYKLVGKSDALNVWMGTFHSVFARILRIEGERLGYPSNFTIYDTDDSKKLIRAIIKEQNLNDKTYQVNYVMSRISSAKSSLVSPQEYNSNGEILAQDRSAGKPMIGKIYQIYNIRLYKSSAMDFDDLLFNMNVLLRDFPEVLYKYQQKFKYILVDEYQDTNYAQYLIVKKLAANNENLCVVGDDAQSIYAFRGANIENILNLKKDYPELSVYKLEQNYRSTKQIVSAANGVIVNNKDQIFKEIWTENEDGNKIKILKATSDNEEGQVIASSIVEYKMGNQLANKDFAVLYRTNAQSRAIEEALRKRNIPYRIYGGLSFYQRKEIKDLLAYFRVVVNFNDEEALKRIINYPARGIGKTSMERVVIAANQYDKSLWDIISRPEVYKLQVNNRIRQKMRDFTTMIRSFAAIHESKNAYEVASFIASSSGILKELYNDKTPEGLSRYENIEELLNAIKDFSEKAPSGEQEEKKPFRTLGEFMQEVALLTDADKDDKSQTDQVTLMTIHAAKGLEFPYVFISGVEENLFPSQLSLASRADLEEERRLFYVAITRAMKMLTISYAQTRYRWGNLTGCEASRFIDELDEKYIDLPRKIPMQQYSEHRGGVEPEEAAVSKKPKKNLKKVEEKNKTGDGFTSPVVDEIQTGMNIEHRKFGKGKVISTEGNGSNKKATVFFTNYGQKQLLLKFAKIKIL